jgi:ABC-type branched-subunit amino acid transport system ATPase component
MNLEILRIKSLTKDFGRVRVLNNVGFSVHQKEVVGLLGTNGAGKTTIFNIITGFLGADNGEIFFKDEVINNRLPHQISLAGIARTFQENRLIHHLTVMDNILLSFQYQSGENLRNLAFKWKYVVKRETTNQRLAIDFLQTVHLVEKQNELAKDLSYGQQKLLSIICCLATGSTLLLLDEPLAGLSPAMIDQVLPLIQCLPSQGKSVLLIEHNLDTVIKLCDRVIFMDAGAVICEGSPQDVCNDPRFINAYL